MTTSTVETSAIECARVFHGANDLTVFVTPLPEDDYAFRIAASFMKTEVPSFEHREKGDIVIFPERLPEKDVRRIAEFAKVGEIVYFPGRIKNIDPQLELARTTLGPLRPKA